MKNKKTKGENMNENSLIFDVLKYILEVRLQEIEVMSGGINFDYEEHQKTKALLVRLENITKLLES